MPGRLGSVIQGSFEGPWNGARPGGLSLESGRRRPDDRAWLLPPSLLPTDSGAGGQPLPGPLRQELEGLFRTGFEDVRIQASPRVPALGARALACGSVIVFAPGRYAPSTAEGRRLLGHELTHVVQQKTGRAINPFGRGLALLRDRALEAEADRMGDRVAAHAGPARLGPEVDAGDRRARIAAEQFERVRGRMAEDQIRRQYAGRFVRDLSSGQQAGPGGSLPGVVYHGTSVVLDHYPTAQSNWFTWDLEAARRYSRALPGVSLVYKYSVINRSDRELLVLRHRGEFSKSLDRLMGEQGKSVVVGWIELEPGTSMMLSRSGDHLKYEGVMGCVIQPGDGGGRDGGASWTGWRPSVEQIEAESGMRHRFSRGRRGIGNRGAYDRLLAQEIARRLNRPHLPLPTVAATTAGETASGRIDDPRGNLR